MSMMENRSLKTVRSFQTSAATPNLGDKLSPKREKAYASRSKALPSKLPSLGGNAPVPVQNTTKDSLPALDKPQMGGRRNLEPVGATVSKSKSTGKDDPASVEIKKKKTRRKDRKAEEKKIVKDQVNVALKAVREVFVTTKGQNILKLETRVHRATENGSFTDLKVKRKDASGSLGISFTIPARVMALGWESGQHLVVTDVTEKPGVKSSLKKGDIVVSVDKEPCHTIADLKKCVAGKTKMKFRCIRDDTPISEEELDTTQKRIEVSLKAAVKAKVKESIRARKKQKSQDL